MVPANSEVGIDVVFSPTEYSTSIMELKVCIQSRLMPTYIVVHVLVGSFSI